MSNVNDGAAGAPGQPAPVSTPGFIGGFAPAPIPDMVPLPTVDAAAVAKPVDTKPESEVKSEERVAATPEQPSRLAELIRESREAKARAAAEATTAQKASDELAAARAEIAALKRSQSFEDDPIAYIKSRKMTPEQQALLGQTLLFDLVPDKAPEGFRQKLFEDRQARKEREAEEKRQAEAAERATEAQAQQISGYVADLQAAAETFDEGSYPESKAWFGDDQTTYVRSLFATANNLAARAKQTGQRADLSPAAVAAALEQELRARYEQREQRAAKRKTPTQTPAPTKVETPPSGMQPAGTPMSTQGLGAGTPRPPAKTEEERIARAAEAAFAAR